MAALTTDRKTVHLETDELALPAAASVTVFYGSLVNMDTSGNARPGRATATDVCVGVNLDARVDNSSGSAGDKKVKVSKKISRFVNNGGSIDASDIGSPCYVVDDQSVDIDHDTNSRPQAGTIHSVDALGVFVKFA